MPKTTPTEYPFDAQNYQRTGFSIADIVRWGIPEAPPAVMLAAALACHIRETYPTRGSGPPALIRQLNWRRAHAKRTMRTMSPEQQAIYDARTMAREMGQPREQWPAVPATRTRPLRLSAAERITQLRSRPRLTWRQQWERDMDALQYLGHAIPVSQRPTQTYRTGAGVVKGVPLERRWHSPTSCSGCTRCLRGT